MQFNLYTALPAMILTLVIMRFYYDPGRDLPSFPLGIMSPVDGTVVDADILHDPFLDRTAQCIRIQSDLFGVYHGRSPTEGKMMEYWPALSEDKQEYTKEDTRGVLWIRTDEGDDIIVVVRGKSGWGQVRCKIQAGERAGQARRCGRFPARSVIDILVDDKTFIEATPGQRVKAGVDRIASFNHEQQQLTDIESPG